MFDGNCLGAKLSDLSTFRTKLMGIAALMIIICHANAYHVLLPGILVSIFRWGNIGVDIFFFLSGIGLFYSFNKYSLNSNDKFLTYYRRRFLRIFIPYFIVYVPYCMFFMVLGEYSIGDSFLCLSTLEYWLFHRGAWFVSMIVILYFIAPFLYKVLSGKYKWLFAIGIISTLMILCSYPINDNSSTSILHNTQMAFSRVPSFIVGMTIGRNCKEGKQLSTSHTLLFCLISIVISLLVGVWRCLWLIVPIMLYIFIFLIKLSENSWIAKSLYLLGSISLESYLTNLTLKSILGTLIPAYFTCPLFYGRYLEYCIVIVAGLFLANYVHIIAQKIISRLPVSSI